jgi:hypothetical protein
MHAFRLIAGVPSTDCLFDLRDPVAIGLISCCAGVTFLFLAFQPPRECAPCSAGASGEGRQPPRECAPTSGSACGLRSASFFVQRRSPPSSFGSLGISGVSRGGEGATRGTDLSTAAAKALVADALKNDKAAALNKKGRSPTRLQPMSG